MQNFRASGDYDNDCSAPLTPLCTQPEQVIKGKRPSVFLEQAPEGQIGVAYWLKLSDGNHEVAGLIPVWAMSKLHKELVALDRNLC